MLKQGIWDAADTMAKSIKTYFDLPPRGSQSRAEWLLGKLNGYKEVCTSRLCFTCVCACPFFHTHPPFSPHMRLQVDSSKVRVKYKIEDACGVEVCAYAFAQWHGVTKSALKKAGACARKGQAVSNGSTLLGWEARGATDKGRRAESWIRRYLVSRAPEHNPVDGVAFIDQLVRQDLYNDVYLAEEQAAAVGISTFNKIFMRIFKERNMRWRTANDHANCDLCGKLKKIIENPKLRFSEEQKKARAAKAEHRRNVDEDRAIYDEDCEKSRRPGSKTLSLVTDKAASKNTKHPNIARNEQTKSTASRGHVFMCVCMHAAADVLPNAPS